MGVSYPIRPADESELLAFAEVAAQAFNSNWPTEELLKLERLVFEPERTLAAFDGDQMVGTSLAFSFALTVPGGIVDAAGISGVSVLPSHRRRGILTALMSRQLGDISSGGEPVAVLHASEAAIYGRYGYGSAADEYGFDISCSQARLRPHDDAPRVRLVEPQDAMEGLSSVYDAIRVTRPGMLARSKGWWELSVADPEFMRQGSSPLRCMIAEDREGPRGYALYSAKPAWDSDGIPNGVLSVQELFGIDHAANVSLWANLLSRDLISQVKARLRPADDPLPYLLTDPRQVRAKVSDGLWIRLVDLPAALTQRRYSCDVDVVIDVTDAQVPANSGGWQLRAGGPADSTKPTCEPSAADPDITMPVAALGAAYLGGTRLGALARAGLVTEHRAGAVAALSAALWWDPAPWPAMMF